MYTEFHFNVELKQDTPPEVIKLLEFMTTNEGEAPPVPIPEHKLFGDTRWRFMLQCDSYYFAADTHSTIRYDKIANSHYLCIRCNFKNYGDEIKLFLHWIHPYLSCHEGDFLGFSRYEETEQPTLIFYKGEKDGKESNN